MTFPDIKVIASYGSAVAFIIVSAFSVNAYYAKEVDLQRLKQDVTKDIAVLGESFQKSQTSYQINQMENQIAIKEERRNKINDRLKQKISSEERILLEDTKSEIDKEIVKIRQQQQIQQEKIR